MTHEGHFQTLKHVHLVLRTTRLDLDCPSAHHCDSHKQRHDEEAPGKMTTIRGQATNGYMSLCGSEDCMLDGM